MTWILKFAKLKNKCKWNQHFHDDAAIARSRASFTLTPGRWTVVIVVHCFAIRSSAYRHQECAANVQKLSGNCLVALYIHKGASQPFPPVPVPRNCIGSCRSALYSLSIIGLSAVSSHSCGLECSSQWLSVLPTDESIWEMREMNRNRAKMAHRKNFL